MSPEARANVRITLIIIAANVAVNGMALLGYNAMRQSAMSRAGVERAAIVSKLDSAALQRDRLTARLMKACRR